MDGPETFDTHKAWSNTSTLSDLSVESSLDLGMSLPSIMGHSGHEMPPMYGQKCGYVWSKIWTLVIASCLYKN